MTKVAAAEQAYDDDGNLLTSSEGLTLVWDGENRLLSSTKGNVTTTYQYDCLSRRTSKETNGATTRFLYDGWNMVIEYAGDVVDTRYTWGMDLSGSMQGAGGVGGLLAVTDASSNHSYPTYDGNGNVSEYLTADSSIVAHYEYDAFGNEIESKTTGASANDYAHKFSTKYQDKETDCYYYGYRYYNPVTGTWPSRDPIEEFGHKQLKSLIYWEIASGALIANPYNFVKNNTLRYYDINGEAAGVIAGGAVIVGAIAQAACFGIVQRFSKRCAAKTTAAQGKCDLDCETFEPWDESLTCLGASWSGPCGGQCVKN